MLDTEIQILMDGLTKTKDTYIHIRVSQEIKDKLNKICKDEHRSQSEQIAYWIESHKK
jgi:predicted DNA-binding protein